MAWLREQGLEVADSDANFVLFGRFPDRHAVWQGLVEQGVLILEAGSSDDAQAVERVDAVLDGDDISIAFNPTFLLDGLSAIDSPVAQLSFTTSTKPALLSGRPAVDAEADDAYKYLIMPVRLSG